MTPEIDAVTLKGVVSATIKGKKIFEFNFLSLMALVPAEKTQKKLDVWAAWSQQQKCVILSFNTQE